MQLSLYYVESDSPERLVLRARRIGAYLAGALLLVGGAWVAVGIWYGFVTRTSIPLPLYLVAEGVGLLLIWGGAFLVSHGLANRDRIIVDNVAREVRVEHARWMEPAVPFDAIRRVVLRAVVEERSSKSPSGALRSESVLLHQVELERADGESLVVDKGSDASWALNFATTLADRCGVPYAAAD
jgi:hypothetical protein